MLRLIFYVLILNFLVNLTNIIIPIKMRKLLVLLFALLAIATCQSVYRTDGGKVKVDFFYESLCPYCQQYIQKSLKTAAATKVNHF